MLRHYINMSFCKADKNDLIILAASTASIGYTLSQSVSQYGADNGKYPDLRPQPSCLHLRSGQGGCSGGEPRGVGEGV